jgi:histidyl-tRNA synthetase
VIKAVLARSFEYYSGLVMRIDAGGIRVAAGGRYDDLIGLVGSSPVPACGFALYVAPIVEAMPSLVRDRSAHSIILRAESYGSEVLASLYAAADRLRAAGYIVESVEGLHSAGRARLVVGDQAPRFRLEREGSIASFDEIGAVIDALEAMQ